MKITGTISILIIFSNRLYASQIEEEPRNQLEMKIAIDEPIKEAVYQAENPQYYLEQFLEEVPDTVYSRSRQMFRDDGRNLLTWATFYAFLVDLILNVIFLGLQNGIRRDVVEHCGTEFRTITECAPTAYDSVLYYAKIFLPLTIPSFAFFIGTLIALIIKRDLHQGYWIGYIFICFSEAISLLGMVAFFGNMTERSAAYQAVEAFVLKLPVFLWIRGGSLGLTHLIVLITFFFLL